MFVQDIPIIEGMIRKIAREEIEKAIESLKEVPVIKNETQVDVVSVEEDDEIK